MDLNGLYNIKPQVLFSWVAFLRGGKASITPLINDDFVPLLFIGGNSTYPKSVQSVGAGLFWLVIVAYLLIKMQIVCCGAMRTIYIYIIPYRSTIIHTYPINSEHNSIIRAIHSKESLLIAQAEFTPQDATEILRSLQSWPHDGSSIQLEQSVQSLVQRCSMTFYKYDQIIYCRIY